MTRWSRPGWYDVASSHGGALKPPGPTLENNRSLSVSDVECAVTLADQADDVIEHTGPCRHGAVEE
jgi:hypothetical protein